MGQEHSEAGYRPRIGDFPGPMASSWGAQHDKVRETATKMIAVHTCTIWHKWRGRESTAATLLLFGIFWLFIIKFNILVGNWLPWLLIWLIYLWLVDWLLSWVLCFLLGRARCWSYLLSFLIWHWFHFFVDFCVKHWVHLIRDLKASSTFWPDSAEVSKYNNLFWLIKSSTDYFFTSRFSKSHLLPKSMMVISGSALSLSSDSHFVKLSKVRDLVRSYTMMAPWAPR